MVDSCVFRVWRLGVLGWARGRGWSSPSAVHASVVPTRVHWARRRGPCGPARPRTRFDATRAFGHMSDPARARLRGASLGVFRDVAPNRVPASANILSSSATA